ncbi:Golgi membrane exchange factor (Ric1p-Rgp1p) subunit [Rhodotorula kratochvilovae]
MSSAPGGLSVTVTPSASAFFAGELFTATITLRNTLPPAAPLGPPHGAPSPAHAYAHARTASSVTPSSWQRPPVTPQRHPTGGTGAAGYFDPPASAQPSPHGSALHPSLSAAASASTSHLSPSPSARRALPSPLARSPGPSSPSSAPAQGAPLPTRKGLIGKPPSTPEPRAAPAGLYGGGPRRPGVLGSAGSGRGHARAQSMAASSPDLLLRGSGAGAEGGRNLTAPALQGRGHAKGWYGGSVAGVRGVGSEEDLRGAAAGARDHGPPEGDAPSPADDAPQPNFPDDAAFPVSASTSAPAPPVFPRRPTFGHQRTPSHLGYPGAPSPSSASGGIYGAGGARARLSTISLASQSDSDLSGTDEEEGDVPPLNGRSPYGAPPPSRRFFSAPPAPPAPTHEPNTLSVLWAFAHLEGAFEVDESLIKPAEFVGIKRLLAGGQGGVGVGGGTLEERRAGGGWRSWLFGGGAGGAAQGREDEGGEGAASLEERKKRAVEERAVPMLSCPPSILGVDVMLKPGESRSYTYTLRIPADLPPSFRGRAIKFNYHLVVGTHRVLLGPSAALAGDAPRAGRAKGSVSRVMRVPLRVYNHVGVTGARPFYDLTNPVIFQRDEATTADVDDRKAQQAVQAPKVVRPDTGKADFESYASTLLASVVTNSPELVARSPGLSPTLEAVRSPSLMEAPPALRPEMSSHRGGAGEAFGVEEEGGGCKAAVEIVSRNSQKVSYDINKDGYQVASLTLVKSAYRLGETVNGSVLINGAEGRVLRVSARLETHELVETSIATLPAPRMRQITRRQHAEHHEMVLDSARIGFALAIPSGATPDFGTSGVKLQWSVKLSFLVIPPSPDAPPGGPSQPPSRRGTPAPPSNGAAAPPRAPSAGGHHGRSKSFAYGFEPAVPLTLPPPPMIAPSGAAHLMPVPAPPPADPAHPQPPSHVSYRAVPDLGYVPVPFSSAAPDKPGPPPIGPLQKTARGAMHRPSPSMSAQRAQGAVSAMVGSGSTVLVPAKVETVECSIPIKCYPGNTPFRPTVSVFEA